ncbi:sensor histidine kinase [Modestobacter roseus]|uniref:histidine kinase n=1 Tax=Modestobacter roseus TaxID=1181884 RepID=A0A562IME1_9ACTN|nr:sensor histidine kinase [Modestobacter roseus]MQA33773.1 sensor histidine kinase [Modestobacter roseus]TWH72042.1 signal transduction histidine kinase [Modestobacter roseus]
MITDTAVLPAGRTDRLPRRRWWRQLGVDTGYVLLAFPLSLLSFVLVVTGLAAGAGLVVIWVGVPLLAGTLYAARGFAALERSRLPAVLGRVVPTPGYHVADPGASALRRLITPLRDPQRWLDALHALLHLGVATPAFSLVVAWWSVALGGLTFPAWGWALPDGPDDQDLPELLGFDGGLPLRIAVYAVIGLVFALTLPAVVRGCALAQAQLGRGLLTWRGEAQAEIGRLSEGRDAAVAAEAVALRRLERDIHDGPQQRLVRLSMDLHRAERMLERDPAGARTTLREAAEQTRETLEELRALSRGIAPPVLADRGLAAALAAVAARSPVPVELAVDLAPGQRLAPAVENSAYFLVSEALANAAKHSEATVARVSVVCRAGRLRVEVEDDGRGGAVLAPGHGLAGLADRLRAVDGVLAVDSPRGGPTRLIGDLPCP